MVSKCKPGVRRFSRKLSQCRKTKGAARLYNLVLALVTAETQSSNTELSNMASGKRSRFFIG
jgi:hypothetical protein